MKSIEYLDRIGQDVNRIYFNNAGAIEDIDKITAPKNIPPKTVYDAMKFNTVLLRQDLQDTLQANRELIALLHLTSPLKEIDSQQIDNAFKQMQPDELSEIPKEKEPKKKGEIPWSIQKRITGEFNDDCSENHNN